MTMFGGYSWLRVERGPVAIVTLNRPEAGNAVTLEMIGELADATERLEADDEVRVIVVTGAGRMFCVGTDLSGARSTWADQDDWPEDGRSHPSWRSFRTPFIAAINGPAVGAGMALAIECDIRIAADDAKLGFVFARRGIIADGDAHWWLPRLIGASKALELLLTGSIITGQQAERCGLVSRSVPSADVLPTALGLAHDIASNTSPLAVAAIKGLTYELLEQPNASRAHDVEWQAFTWMGKQPDAAEGVESFLEKRLPAWMGKKSDVEKLRQRLAED
jgi:enoyl-CoA hydratase/carnithine racemase